MKTRALSFIAVAVALLASTACTRSERVREMDWAKSALARNPAYEILATDNSAGVFTVRDTATGTVSALRLEDLVATPLARAPAAAKAAPAQAAAAAGPSSANGSAAPEASPGEPATAGTQPDDAGIDTAGQTTADVLPERAPNGAPLAEGPGYSISRGAPAAPQAAPATLEGPGYSVTRTEPASRPATRQAETGAAANAERRSDPIICQGDRLMRIDGETLDFTGDALIAEQGCDLYISNARIRAGGVGLIARQARVHIVNSTIGGSRASYEASDGAEIYVTRSTINGVGRRFDTATMTDLGGNNYKSQ
jgi:hypothetical protein